ncbi:MAG: hypothetical protein ACRC4M_05020 [Mycoplasma sp.]
MKIIFKQIWKTFNKNIFLIFGFSILVTALSFIFSTALSLTLSFNGSIKNINSEGEVAKVVSTAPNSFGHLDFSYSKSSEESKIIVSNLSLQQEADGTYKREKHTMYPASFKDVFLDDATTFTRAGLGIKTGLTYLPGATEEEDQFIFDEEYGEGTNKKPFWEWSETFLKIGTAPNGKSSISFALIDDNDGSVMLDPSDLMFNKYGIPIYNFKTGSYDSKIALYSSLNEANFNEIKTNREIYDANGVGIPERAFNRAEIKFNPDGSIAHNIHNSKWLIDLNAPAYEFWKNGRHDILDVFSRYIKEETVNPYVFKLNLNDSYGPIKSLLQKNPEIFGEAFNNAYPTLNIKRNDAPAFVDPEEFANPFEFIEDKKEVHLNIINLPDGSDEEFLTLENFKNNLVKSLTTEIYKIFENKYDVYLNQNGIIKNIEKEHFYLDSRFDIEYLFVKKENNGVNNIVISQGSNIEEYSNIKKWEKTFKERDEEGKYTKYIFKSIEEMFDQLPQESLPKRPNNPTIGSSNYFLMRLFRHSLSELNKIFATYPGPEISQKALDSPHFKLLANFLHHLEVSYNISNISLLQSFASVFTTLGIGETYVFYISQNLFAVVSNSYADLNKKKYIPEKTDSAITNLWIQKLNELWKGPESTKEKVSKFKNWINTLDEKKMQASIEVVEKHIMKYPVFFDAWIEEIPQDYIINYKNNVLLIRGFGLSPDYAFPVISPTSPMPSPSSQVVVYLNEMSFNNLKVVAIDINSYYSYNSKTLNEKQILSAISTFLSKEGVSGIFKFAPLSSANFLQTVYMRTSFPKQIRNMIIIFCTVAMIFIGLLSLFIVALLMKSILKKLMEPISICVANGIPLSKVMLMGILNISIWTTIATSIGYLISVFTQSVFASIVSPIWLMPLSLMGFNIWIFIAIFSGSIGLFAGIFALTLYSKFKKPVPSLLSNKEDIKNNKITKLMRTTKSKTPFTLKLSYGFSSVNIGRLSLLVALSFIALGSITTLFTINDKFDTSRALTLESRNYETDYNFSDVIESTGLYKTQEFADLGLEDISQGIYSVYPNDSTSLPYNKMELQARRYNPKTGKTELVHDKYFSNLVLPSYKIYNDLQNGDVSTFFNSVTSLFLIDLNVNIAGMQIQLWSMVKQFFPEWVVHQLESQSRIFEEAILKYYGEWIYNFFDYSKNTNVLGSFMFDDADRSHVVDINSELNYGYYMAKAVDSTSPTNKKYLYSDPIFVWPENHDQFYKSDIQNSQRIIVSVSDDVTLQLTDNMFDGRNIKKTQPIEWIHIPTFDNNKISLQSSKISNDNKVDLSKIKFNEEFIEFITTIYFDKRVAVHDSKLTFGIIPFDEKTDEKYTRVKANITSLYDFYGNRKTPNKSNIQIFGVNDKSENFILNDRYKEENISNLISNTKVESQIPVIINNGAALEYGLKEGDIIDISVLNNSLDSSFKTIGTLLGIDDKPIKTNHTLKVVGINSDSFGERFYINNIVANKILDLDNMYYYNSMDKKTDANSITEITLDRIEEPFNSIITSDLNNTISKNALPFYTFSNIWNNATTPSEVRTLPLDKVYDSLLTLDRGLLIKYAEHIKNEIDPSFVYVDDGSIEDLRDPILNFISTKYSTMSNFFNLLNDIDQELILQFSLDSILPSDATIEIFDMMSSLISLIGIATSVVLVPLLLIVSTITSMSIIQDLVNNILLLKILGYSNRNILISLGLMYIPVFILSTVVGLGITFATSFGLQYLTYSLTSIFISPFINPLIFMLGVTATAFILSLSLLYIYIYLKNKKMQNALKF